MKLKSNYRWFVFAIFFVFMLLHQADKLLIGPLTKQIMDDFGLTLTQMGAVSTGALLVGAICYPLWGYLYDRYARSRLLAAASFIWGATTWLNAIAPTYGFFLVTRSSTGIDDSSYPGLYSLISDYFGPKVRGKIYGFLQLTAPLGYMLGMILGLLLSNQIGWRGVFYLTGGLGIVISALILLGVKEAPRGRSEPEMEGMEEIGVYRFDWKIAKDLFKIRSLRLMFIQGFFGVFPWNAITYFFFTYLSTERGYSENEVFITMVIAVLVLAAGYPVGGALGDYFFKRNPRGRMAVAGIGVIIGAVLLAIALYLPIENKGLFLVVLALDAFFIPFASPNVTSSVYDVTLPEVRSTANAVESFLESGGAALSPLLVGLIADRSSLQSAFLIICTSTWVICAIVFIFTTYYIPGDIEKLRGQLRQRAEYDRIHHPGKALDSEASTLVASGPAR
ncbi:MAG: MFS transporter [Chloroflexota bacterium]|nr:MAG: MFS transporter [Chloroflexota bacterium]